LSKKIALVEGEDLPLLLAFLEEVTEKAGCFRGVLVVTTWWDAW
jgi:hypothetical protein